MEMINFDPVVKAEILKRLSINLCCNVSVRGCRAQGCMRC